MTVQAFLSILIFCSAATSLLVEAIKKTIDDGAKEVPTNFIVLLVALVVGCGATTLYYVEKCIPFDLVNVVCIVLMGIANWIGAMVGYDKVKQLIEQIGAIE